MRQIIINRSMSRAARPCAVVALCALAVVPLHADEFPLFGGKAAGIWKTQIVFGGAMRITQPQPSLIGAGASKSSPLFGPAFIEGATGAVGVNDDSDLNFRRGDWTSAPVTFVSDFRLNVKTSGVFVRVRGWYDMLLATANVRYGSVTQKFTNNTPLKDTGFEGAAKFHGLDIYDAFYYGNYNAGPAKLQLRVGRQALSWGEGIFYPGINAFNAADFSWVTMPGSSLVNGGLLPTARVYANAAFKGGWTLEGFYNLEFRPSNIPGCGTYYSMVDNAMQPGCNVATAGGLRDDVAATVIGTRSYWGGTLPAGGYLPNGGPDNPVASRMPKWSDSGYGLALHQFVEGIKSEVGLYYAHYANPMPNVSTLPSANPLDFAVNNTWVKGIEAVAVSLSTGMRNTAIGVQVTDTFNYPAQRNFPHLIQGAMQGIGPYADQANYVGTEYPGYKRMNILQPQVNATWQIGQLLHLSNAVLVAETAMQWATDFPGMEAERIGRYGNFGIATWNGGNCSPGPDANGVVNQCAIDGFGSAFAWGYKLRAVAVLPTSKHGVTWTPSVSFGQDLTGFSMDGAIVGGRVSYGAGIRADIKARYFFEIGANSYRKNAPFDPLRDRGLLTMDFGISVQ
jgi:hypothetical protein